MNAQIVHSSEDFTGGLPAGWTTADVDGLTTHPNIAGGNLTGCTAFGNIAGWIGYCDVAISCSWYDPAGQADDWLITAAIQVPAGQPNVFIRWDARAYSTRADSRDDYAVRISTTTNTPGAAFITSLYDDTNPEAFWETKVADISAYAGQTVYIAFHNFENDGLLLGLDNFEIVTLPERDLVGQTFNNDSYLTQNSPAQRFSGTFFNAGGTTVSSVEVKYTVDNGSEVATTINGLNILPYTFANIDHPTAWNPTVDGASDIKYWISQINGMSDVNPGDNELNKGFSRTSNPSNRNVLLETFTSSTCPPCLQGNINMEFVLDRLNDPSMISIRYQQNFPGTGDPYATTEGVNRRGLYNQNSIPHTVVDGFRQRTNSASLNQGMLTGAKALPAFGDFAGTYMLDVPNQMVDIKGTFTPSTDMVGVERLQVAILETETFNNVKNNGEREFLDVVKKMLPNEEGVTLSGTLTAGMPYTFDQQYTFSGNYRLPQDGQTANRINDATEHSIEDFANLFVVVWVENVNNQRYILNADKLTRAYAVGLEEEIAVGKLNVSPNPASSMTKIDLNLIEASTVKLEVVNELGQVVLTKEAGTMPAGANAVELNVSELPAGIYHVSALMEKGVISRPLMIVR
ncbi:MAG: choice-of-anchor J domain-containing protein [Bacteroidia bacterium]